MTAAVKKLHAKNIIDNKDMNVSLLELKTIEKHITDLISMEFVELRTMASINIVENMPTTCSYDISFYTYCWHAMMFIFEFIGLAWMYTNLKENNQKQNDQKLTTVSQVHV